MATKVIMPKQGLQMTEGTITRWISKEGEQVKAEQPLFEMETDKLTIEINAPATGTLLKIIRDEGETVPLTEIIAVIGEPGEDISALLAEAGANGAPAAPWPEAARQEPLAQAVPAEAQVKRDEGARVFITPRARLAAAAKAIDVHQVDGTGTEGLIIERDVLNFAAKQPFAPRATPVAARMAEQHDIQLSGLSGSGARGKIMKADVEAAIAARRKQAAGGGRTGRIIPFAGKRKVIAERMMQSLHGMAQANHRMKVDMSESIRFREKLKAAGIKVSFTDIFVKIVAKALLEFQIINSSLTDEGILLKDYVHMGVAVAVDNGLIVPVIKDADLLTLAEISTVAAELIDKARKGSLAPEEYTGGTFTITNLGMFDIDEFTAIINPPESAILAIGKIDKVPVVEEDRIVVKPILVLSLTYDHRVIDGAPAAQFLQRVKQLMQNPYLLI